MENSYLRLIQSLILFAFLAILSAVMPASAYASTADTSAYFAQPEGQSAKVNDNRAKILESYLHRQNSPLSPYSADFIREADKNKLDWELLPSIAGVESTFGQFLPANSYNGWGFGIYGNHVMRFSSWKEAIATIAKSLKHDYIEKYGAKNVEEIGSVYAADPSWPYKVRHFMAELDSFENPDVETQSLPISL